MDEVRETALLTDLGITAIQLAAAARSCSVILNSVLQLSTR